MPEGEMPPNPLRGLTDKDRSVIASNMRSAGVPEDQIAEGFVQTVTGESLKGRATQEHLDDVHTSAAVDKPGTIRALVNNLIRRGRGQQTQPLPKTEAVAAIIPDPDNTTGRETWVKGDESILPDGTKVTQYDIPGGRKAIEYTYPQGHPSGAKTRTEYQ